MKLRILAALFFITLISCKGEQNNHNEIKKEMIETKISLEKEKYAINEEVKLHFEIKNGTTIEQRFCFWRTPFEKRFTGSYLEIKNEKGEKVPYTGILVKRLPPSEADYLTITPNESKTAIVNILEGYKLTKKGTYTITFLAQDEKKLASSNSILVTIE